MLESRASLGKVWYAVPRAPSTWGDINSDFDSRWAVPAVPMYGPWPIIASHAQPCIGDLQIAAEVWTWMCMRRCLNWEGKCEKACKRSLRETREARTYEPSQDMYNRLQQFYWVFDAFYAIFRTNISLERWRKAEKKRGDFHFTALHCLQLWDSAMRSTSVAGQPTHWGHRPKTRWFAGMHLRVKGNLSLPPAKSFGWFLSLYACAGETWWDGGHSEGQTRCDNYWQVPKKVKNWISL